MAFHERGACSREELLSFLLDPHSYPHRPNATRLIQTHAAYVVLAPPYVYKVKKRVDFGFLDYSTLEKRRYFSEREVALNRRLCPHMYLGVIPIARQGARLRFGEGDRIVEYAVKMRKLSERGFMDRRVQQGSADQADIARIVETLTPFYTNQKPTPEAVRAWGQIDRLKVNTDENFLQTARYIGQTISRPAFEAARLYTDRYYETHAALFESRVRDGWIVDGHGDLHLAHIHLTPKRVCIYDCIEFNDRFRYLDVAGDIAFLAMDLDYNERPDLARRLVAEISEALEDHTMPRLMEFYKCYRAYVRGKVESLRSNEPEVPKEERAASRDRAQRYFRLALQYAAIGSKPTALAVMGRIGSGKSTLASALSEALGWRVFNSDRVRKERAGVPAHGRSDATARRRLYTTEMTRKTYRALFEQAAQQLGAGHGVILDATFGNRVFRDQLREQARQFHASYHFIEATASDAVLKQRLKARNRHPDEISDARLENFDTLTRAYTAPDELDSEHRLTIDTETALDTTLDTLFTALVSQHVART